MVSALLLQTREWGAGVELTHGAEAWLGLAGLVLFAGGWGFLALRAFLRRERYRATGVLTPEDLAAVRAALAAAERKTVGEILPVVLERSDRYPGGAWLASLVALGSGSLLLAPWLPWDAPLLVLLAQLGLAVAGLASARLPDVLRLFVSAAREREMAEEQAFQEFHRHDLTRTEGRTGVLLLVSLLEHRVVVLADEGINARVGTEAWQATSAAVLEGIRRGSLRDGVIAGIRSAGALLAEHAPVAEGDRNEVPDRVIVRRE
jgi:putative membrane protein